MVFHSESEKNTCVFYPGAGRFLMLADFVKTGNSAKWNKKKFDFPEKQGKYLWGYIKLFVFITYLSPICVPRVKKSAPNPQVIKFKLYFSSKYDIFRTVEPISLMFVGNCWQIYCLFRLQSQYSKKFQIFHKNRNLNWRPKKTEICQRCKISKYFQKFEIFLIVCFLIQGVFLHVVARFISFLKNY